MSEFITVNAKNVAFKRHKQIICTERFDFSQELWNILGFELGFGDIIKTVSYAIEKYPLSPTQDVLLSLHLKNWKEITHLSCVAQ